MIAIRSLSFGPFSTRRRVLAWLLARSPAMLPIPGTGSVPHVEENVTASSINLEPDEVAALQHAA